jgi:hypothetical protein
LSKFEGLKIKMTTDSTFIQNKTIEETAHDIGVAVGKGAGKACTTIKAFGDGVRKGMDENESLERIEVAGASVIEGVKDGAEKVGKAAEAFGDGIKKGIDDAKPLDVKMKDAGEAVAKTVAKSVDELKKDVKAEKDRLENY